MHLGFRIEIAKSLMVRNFAKRVNSKKWGAQVFELIKDGKIAVEKKDGMLIAHGLKSDSKTSVYNFSLLCEIEEGEEELCRLVQIMNVLGNDRLIKEKISALIGGKSLLNALPQLEPVKNTIVKIDKNLIPGFVQHGWYYAPEALFDETN
jgi:hypothetical protein